MPVGIQPPKSDIDNQSGDVARRLAQGFELVRQFKFWLDTQTDAYLISLGYIQAEVDRLRSAYADLDQLRTIYEGTAALAVAKDFRAFSKLLFGFGFVSSTG